MPKYAKITLIVILGVLIVSYFIFGFSLAVISLTKGQDGLIKTGNQVAIVATTNLMQGSREGSFSRGELVRFDKIDTPSTLAQNDVILYKVGDALSIKRIRYMLVDDKNLKIYASVDQDIASTVSLIDADDVIGVYTSSSLALGNLISFSSKFSGVLVLYILPSIMLFGYATTLVIVSYKKAR